MSLTKASESHSFFQAIEKIKVYGSDVTSELSCFQSYALENKFAFMALEGNNCFLKSFFLSKYLYKEHADIKNVIFLMLSSSP